MTTYRIRLETADGRPCKERLIECENDDQAIDCVGEWDDPLAMTIWQADRCVARVPAVVADPLEQTRT